MNAVVRCTLYIPPVDHRCIRTCGFRYYPCGSRSPLNYAVSILPVIAPPLSIPARNEVSVSIARINCNIESRMMITTQRGSPTYGIRAPSNSCRTIAGRARIPGILALRVPWKISGKFHGRVCEREHRRFCKTEEMLDQKCRRAKFRDISEASLCANRFPPPPAP